MYSSQQQQGNLGLGQAQTLKQILKANTLFCSLHQQIIIQFFTAMKIPLTLYNNVENKSAKVMEKLIDIIIEQRQECVNYLSLPKFRNLSGPAKLTLTQILQEAWDQFKQKYQKAEKQKKFSMYYCKSENLHEMQSFHLDLLNYFKMGFFHPTMSHNAQFYQPPEMMNFPNMQQQFKQFDNYNPYNAISQKPAEIGYQTTPKQGQFPLFSTSNVKVEQAPYINGRNQYYQPHNRYQIQKSIHKINHNQANFQNDQDHNLVKIKEEDDENIGYSAGYQKPSKKKRNNNQDNEQSAKARTSQKFFRDIQWNPYKEKNTGKKNFNNCYCKGKKQISMKSDNDYFQCEACLQLLHLSCLRIPKNLTVKPGTKKMCPICILRKQNAFYWIMGQPVQTFWIQERDLPKTKINIKGKKFRQIIQNKYSIQLRFLKASGKNMFEWNQQGESLVLNRNANGFNQIIIKQALLKSGGGDDIKINLDFLSNPNNVNNANLPALRKASLIYLVVFAVKKKTKEQMMQNTYEDTSDSFYNSLFQQVNQKLKIDILSTNLQLIDIPARGSQCTHVDVFDLEQFITNSLEMDNQNCHICLKKCLDFKIDIKLQTQLNKIRQLYPDPDNIPSPIYLTKSGKFEYQDIEQPISESPQIQSQNSEEDIEISMSNNQKPDDI